MGSGEQLRDDDGPGRRVEGQQAEIQQGVDVGAQQQTVGDVIGVRSAVGAQVGGFQGGGCVAAGDGASSLVGLQERGPEAGLPAAGHDLPVDPKTGIVIVIQALAAGRRLLLQLGSGGGLEDIADRIGDRFGGRIKALEEEVPVRPAAPAAPGRARRTGCGGQPVQARGGHPREPGPRCSASGPGW